MRGFTRLLWIFSLLVLAGCAVDDPAAKSMPTTPPELSAGVQTVSGVVLGGGDQTPQGLMDAPRTFIYQLRLDSGEEISLTYTAYPYSPAAESRPVIRLTFHAGEIKPGFYLSARGTYDPASKTLTVAGEGDFIETSAEKP
jgi:hypothetical protein